MNAVRLPPAPGETTGVKPPGLTLLLGNPNVGKSVIFGALTGRYATVSNYPGTTVEVYAGRRPNGAPVLDLPGTNSLLPASEDEQVTRDALLEHHAKAETNVVLVCDAKNLRRGVLLALELSELELPSLFVANMLDEAHSRGIRVDLDRLGELLGVPVLGTVATRRQGLAALTRDTARPTPATVSVSYPAPVEQAIDSLVPLLPTERRGRRGLALMLLAADASLHEWAQRRLGDHYPQLADIRARCAGALHEPIRVVLHRARLAAADALVDEVLTRKPPSRQPWARRFGELAMHPAWGLPIAAAVLYLTYLVVGVFGAGVAVEFFEGTLFAEHLVPWLDAGLRAITGGFVEEFLVGPPGVELGRGPGLLIGDYGLASMALAYAVAIVLPIVAVFFLVFSVMEDSGYLPRLAVVLNRAFRLVGLNGKAVLPMILGLGCDTMATMTTRILATPKERVVVTLLLALGVPCSAQLGVILGLVAGISGWGIWVWLGTVLAVMAAVGFLAGRLLPGKAADFVLEIPPIRRPELRNILIKTAARIEWYLKEAVPLFMVATFLLWVLAAFDALGRVQNLFAPVVETFLGLPAEATDAFLVGFLRRDYGAAGLFHIFSGALAEPVVSIETEIQVVVSLVTITLFVPCVANVLMIVKERGLKTAVAMTAFIFPFAFLVGGLLNRGLRAVLL